uniref:Uncharacterized protein n=1 Tax=Anguilla anguilla TaxID=7936 RepID=A0A0E9WUJ1_ANGAN
MHVYDREAITVIIDHVDISLKNVVRRVKYMVKQGYGEKKSITHERSVLFYQHVVMNIYNRYL